MSRESRNDAGDDNSSIDHFVTNKNWIGIVVLNMNSVDTLQFRDNRLLQEGHDSENLLCTIVEALQRVTRAILPVAPITVTLQALIKELRKYGVTEFKRGGSFIIWGLAWIDELGIMASRLFFTRVCHMCYISPKRGGLLVVVNCYLACISPPDHLDFLLSQIQKEKCWRVVFGGPKTWIYDAETGWYVGARLWTGIYKAQQVSFGTDLE